MPRLPHQTRDKKSPTKHEAHCSVWRHDQVRWTDMRQHQNKHQPAAPHHTQEEYQETSWYNTGNRGWVHCHNITGGTMPRLPPQTRDRKLSTKHENHCSVCHHEQVNWASMRQHPTKHQPAAPHHTHKDYQDTFCRNKDVANTCTAAPQAGTVQSGTTCYWGKGA